MFADLMKSSKLGRKVWKGLTMKPKARAGSSATGDGEWKSMRKGGKAQAAPDKSAKKAGGK